MWQRWAAVMALISLFTALAADGALAAPTVTGVRIDRHDTLTRLVFDLTEAVDFKIFTLTGPNRVVIDLPPMRWALEERELAIGHAGVTRLRFGHFRPDTSRIVLDLTQPFVLRQAQLLTPGKGGATVHRLILDLVPVSQPAFRAAAQPAEPAAQEQKTVPPDRPAEPVPLPRLKPPPEPVRYLIAIDPGHGGRDPGAVAASGVKEKAIVLTFARELRAALEASDRYRVVLTRDGDRKVALRRRVATARNVGADLFLSIHVDRLDDSAVRGASVYTLSDEASDAETAALATRENKADIVADVDLTEGYDAEVTQVLISLVQQNTMNCSATLAALLVPSLGRVAPLINRAHRFADFRVLKAPDIPSVLIELGFLSNDQDAERLRSENHRAALSGAIIEALDGYFRAPC